MMHRSKDKQKVASDKHKVTKDKPRIVIDKPKGEELDVRDPRYWGKSFWFTYDTIVETYPDNPSPKQQQSIRSFFRSQGYLLPCETCADNYRKIYKANPPQTGSKKAMKKWLKKVKAEVAKHSKK